MRTDRQGAAERRSLPARQAVARRPSPRKTRSSPSCSPGTSLRWRRAFSPAIEIAINDDPTLDYRRRLSVDALVGSSRALAQLLKQVSLVAPLDVGVLLTGDSGTGKSLVASIIHANGPRAAEPFVEVNCAAIPENLIESELFGHEKGSFTGATERRRGRFELGGPGHHLPGRDRRAVARRAEQAAAACSRRGGSERVGGTATIESGARVIAATNAISSEHLASGRFREDLFYRLNVLPIHVPSLAERRSDVVTLARCFVERARERHRLPEIVLSESSGDRHPNHRVARQRSSARECGRGRRHSCGRRRLVSCRERAHLFPDEAEKTDGASRTSLSSRRRVAFSAISYDEPSARPTGTWPKPLAASASLARTSTT